MADLPGLDRPFIGAPMAGGPSTPELAAAVCEAGGLGQLAGAYLGVEDLRAQIGRTRELTSRPFGVNLFVPTDTTDAARPEVERYAAALRPEAERHGLTLPEPDWGDTDRWQDKLALLFAEQVAVVSFHFGCPPPQVVQQLHDVGARVVISATSPDEAVAAEAVGADAVCLQAATAGGHRGTHTVAAHPNDLDALALLAATLPVVAVPLVVAGGAGHQGAGAGRARRRRDRGAGRDGRSLRTPEAGTRAVPPRGAGRAGLVRHRRDARLHRPPRSGAAQPVHRPVRRPGPRGLPGGRPAHRAPARPSGRRRRPAGHGALRRHRGTARPREPAGEVVRDLSALTA